MECEKCKSGRVIESALRVLYCEKCFHVTKVENIEPYAWGELVCPACGRTRMSGWWCMYCGYVDGNHGGLIAIFKGDTVRITRWTVHHKSGAEYEVSAIEKNGKIYHYGTDGLTILEDST